MFGYTPVIKAISVTAGQAEGTGYLRGIVQTQAWTRERSWWPEGTKYDSSGYFEIEIRVVDSQLARVDLTNEAEM